MKRAAAALLCAALLLTLAACGEAPAPRRTARARKRRDARARVHARTYAGADT